MKIKLKNELLTFVTTKELEIVDSLKGKYNLTELELFSILDSLASQIRIKIFETN